MTEEKRKELLRIARDSISAAFRGREYHAADDGTENHGAFVTIRLGGSLRGCIGFMEGIGPLGQMVADLAREAAFSDPRFPPLTEEELGRCTLEVSLLTEPEPIPGGIPAAGGGGDRLDTGGDARGALEEGRAPA